MGAIVSYGITSLLDRPRPKEDYVQFLQAFFEQGARGYFSEVFICPFKGRKTPDLTAYRISSSITLMKLPMQDEDARYYLPKDHTFVLKKELDLWKSYMTTVSYIDWTEFYGDSIYLPNYHSTTLQVVQLPGIEDKLSLGALSLAHERLKKLTKRKTNQEQWIALEKIFARAVKFNWPVVVR